MPGVSRFLARTVAGLALLTGVAVVAESPDAYSDYSDVATLGQALRDGEWVLVREIVHRRRE